MNRPFRDITGQRFGRLLVLERDPIIRGRGNTATFVCRCDCGQYRNVRGTDIRKGSTRSCGCLSREVTSARLRTHGHTTGEKKTKEYLAWRNMIARCENPSAGRFSNYGGRGIRVCEEWRGSFRAFLRDVGPAPTAEHSIDRIDVNGMYDPSNVRWATRSVQVKNRRPITGVTSCKRGHPFDALNTYSFRGKRRCRVCAAAYQRSRRRFLRERSIA
jgi:hypothetical protein